MIKSVIERFWRMLIQFFMCSAVILMISSCAAAVGFHTVLMQQLPDDPDMEAPDLNTLTWIVSISGVSTFPAYFLAPILMQNKGRKPAFVAAGVITAIGWIIAYFTPNARILILASAIHGFGTGILDTVGLLSISEFMDPRYRTHFSIATGYTASVVIAITHLLGWYLHWRTLCLIMLAPCLSGLMIGLKWVESPVWLASKGKFQEAKSSFEYLRGTDEANTKEFQEMVGREQQKQKKVTENDIESNVRKENKDNLFISNLKNVVENVKCLLKHMTNKVFYRSMLVVSLVYAVYLASGTHFLGYYLPFLFEEVIQNDDWTFYGQMLYNASNLLGGFMNIILIGKLSNKTFLLISASLTVLTNASITIYLFLIRGAFVSIMPVILVVLLTFQGLVASLGIRAMAFGLQAELIPVSFRGLCTCFVYLLRGSLNTTVIKSTPYMFVYFGFDLTFGIFTLILIGLILLLIPIMPETRGKSLEDIEQFYRRSNTVNVDK